MSARRAGWLVRTERIGYERAWDLQRRMVAARQAGLIPDVVWLLEHEPTFTTGRHGTRADLRWSDEGLAAAGGVFVRSDRGGQMTWHGPGQMTGYVIRDLRPGRRVHAFVDALVEAMRVASGVDGARAGEEAIGLYVGGRKLGSVGIRVSGGVTFHGVALNRDPDLEWPRAMIGCGAPDVPPTSIAAEGGDPGRARVEADFAAALADLVGWELTSVPRDALERRMAAAGSDH
ncbi:MAG TPA: lipoyl(octanoyl) transferase LipB [Miltoncostaeaceae bacterium]|nr:lipoyl(octanoyl) transferase LipB [Miltoncostaeaceae bacterium]